MSRSRLNYKFQKKDDRDHTCKTHAHPDSPHLEVTRNQMEILQEWNVQKNR